MGAGCLNHYWLAKSSGEVVSSIGGLPRHMVGPSVLEMQPRGVTGPSRVEVASLAIENWKFMVVKGRFSGKGSLSLICRTRKEILKGQGIFLEGVMACAEA